MEPLERIARHFRHEWGIPLLAGPPESGDRSLSPASILRAVLEGGDARVVLAAALWLSLLEDGPELEGEWSDPDRRRVGYLCEIARCLDLLREEPATRRPSSWPQRVAGIAPQYASRRVPLFVSPAPPVPSSRFGVRWGIVEVLEFAEYAALQREFLLRRTEEVA
jgi:hypothetical protein